MVVSYNSDKPESVSRVKMNQPMDLLNHVSELEYAARILGVDSDLVVDQLIQRNIQMRGETVTSPLNYSNACDVKDAFIKGWSEIELDTFSSRA